MTALLLKRHAALVDHMTTARGLDLEEATRRGAGDPSDLLCLVLGCAGCTQNEMCEKWLGAQVDAMSAAPHYRRNAHALTDIAKRLG